MLHNEDSSRKVLEFMIDVPGGRRALSKLGRTCKAFFEPAMNVLWKDLDSLVPLIGLFPSHLLRRAKRPGLGLVSSSHKTTPNSMLIAIPARLKTRSRRTGPGFLRTASA